MWHEETKLFLLAKFLPSCMLDIHKNIYNIKPTTRTWPCFLGDIKGIYACQLIPHAVNNFPRFVQSSKRRVLYVWGPCSEERIVQQKSLFCLCSLPTVKESEPPAMVSPACMCFPEKRIKWQRRGERNWRKLQYGRRNLDKYCWRATIIEALYKHCVVNIFFSIWKVFLSNFQFFYKKKKKQRVFLN